MHPKISEPVNSKLGRKIHSWSLPAGKKFSCPGETDTCADRCYAKRGFFLMRSHKNLYSANFLASQQKEFAAWMIQQLRCWYVAVMRIHVSGDFYSAAYVRKWIKIAKASPDVQFFAYTRSWRVAGMLPALIEFGQLPNVQLWWSEDQDTGPSPAVAGIRVAYMAVSDDDAANATKRHDLLFRDGPKTAMKRANGVQVCPVEQSVPRQVKLTCSSCKICWEKAKCETTMPHDSKKILLPVIPS